MSTSMTDEARSARARLGSCASKYGADAPETRAARANLNAERWLAPARKTLDTEPSRIVRIPTGKTFQAFAAAFDEPVARVMSLLLISLFEPATPLTPSQVRMRPFAELHIPIAVRDPNARA